MEQQGKILAKIPEQILKIVDFLERSNGRQNSKKPSTYHTFEHLTNGKPDKNTMYILLVVHHGVLTFRG